ARGDTNAGDNVHYWYESPVLTIPFGSEGHSLVFVPKRRWVERLGRDLQGDREDWNNRVPDDLGFKWTFVGPKGPTTDLQTWIDVGNKGCWEDNLDRIERVTAQWEFWKDVTWGLTPFLGTYAAFDEGDYMIGALSLVG